MRNNIGLCGAHRTGKTTLAIALAEKLNIPFVGIGTSAIFAQHNVDPSKPMDFRTRLGIQRKILDHAHDIWFDFDEPSFICDRTPIDMMAYTIAEVGCNTLDSALRSELHQYLVDCRRVLNRTFDQLILIPPAIPIVESFGKASACPRYIEHIHLLCLGLFHESLVENRYLLPDYATNLSDRVDKVLAFLEKK